MEVPSPESLSHGNRVKAGLAVEYPGSGHDIILSSEEEAGIGRENTHLLNSFRLISGYSPLIPIVLYDAGPL